MFDINFLRDAKIIRVANDAAAATGTVTTSVVDTQGFNSIAFVAALGDVTSTSVLTLTAKTNSANSTSSPAPVASADTVTFTAGATNADNNMLVLDFNKPRQRYVFATLVIGTANAVLDGIFAILYNAQEAPVTPDASVIASIFTNDSA